MAGGAQVWQGVAYGPPMAVAMDNPEAMGNNVRALLRQHFPIQWQGVAVLLDVWHAINRVQRTLPLRAVHPDAPRFGTAVGDAVMLAVQPAGLAPGAAPLPTPCRLAAQAAWLRAAANADVLAAAATAGRAWLGGERLSTPGATAVAAVMREGGWALEPAALPPSAWAGAVPQPTPLLPLRVRDGVSAPMALLAALAVDAGVYRRRARGQPWQTADPMRAGGLPPLPLALGAPSKAAAAAQLQALGRAFAVPRAAARKGREQPTVGLTAPTGAPRGPAAHALGRLASNATLVPLLAAQGLPCGAVGSGPNETYHAILNAVFAGLGTVTVPTWRRLAGMAWLRLVARRAAGHATGAASGDVGVHAAAAAAATALAGELHSALPGAGGGHPLLPHVPASALVGARPATYTADDAAGEGLQLAPPGHGMSSATRRELHQQLDALVEGGELAVPLAGLPVHLAELAGTSVPQAAAVLQGSTQLARLAAAQEAAPAAACTRPAAAAAAAAAAAQ